MGRVTVTPKETAREKRMREARESAAQQTPAPARRGEQDEPEQAPAADLLPQQVAPLEGSVRTAVEVQVSSGFEYQPPPPQASDLELVAHAQRGIVMAGRAAEKTLGRAARDYAMCAGHHLYDLTKNGAFKAAGHKSVEAFAATLGLSRRDVYRLRDAYPVYAALGDLVEEPLSERVIRELAIAQKKSDEGCRNVFVEMKRGGRISAAAAVSARRLLAAGGTEELIEAELPPVVEQSPIEKLNRAREQGRLVDVEMLRAAVSVDPASAKAYVDGLKARYEEAVQIVGD